MVNLFALRSADPKEILRHPYPFPIGPRNDEEIQAEAFAADIIVAAWGAHGGIMQRNEHVLKMLRQQRMPPIFCLGLTKGGHPKHPLYLRADSPLIKMP